jgi:hypothetical protein
VNKSAKILFGLAALGLLFLSCSSINQKLRSKPRYRSSPPKTEEKASSAQKTVSPSQPSGSPESAASRNLVTSLKFLEKKSASHFTLDNVRVTYYVLAKSNRCAVDSVSTCLQEKIQQGEIEEKDFQYTYFLDQAVLEGSGILSWKGRDYFVTYNKLRDNGWAPERGGAKNNYTCSNFFFTSKQALDFIEDNIANKDIFTPIEQASHPNGLTASSQPAVDWQTVSVNPADFPLSVPDAKRRDVLTQRYVAAGQKKPAPRSYILLEFSTGEKFLTEAADTGSGIPRGTIDWRIGNTAAEIAYKASLGTTAKATCYVFDDPTITFEMVLEQARLETEKLK